MKSILLLVFTSFIFLSCDKEQLSLDGFEYPKGIKVVDLKRGNDCSLPKCSSDRILRLKAKDVLASIVNDSILNITWQFDGYIKLFLCTKLDLSQFDFDANPAPRVLVSGNLFDACGIIDLTWPTIEYYFFDLKKIEPFD